MRGLAAWIATFWLLSIPLNVVFIGDEFNGAGDWIQMLLIVIICWVVANKAERAVNRYYANKEAPRG